MIRAGPLVCAGLTVICLLRAPEREAHATRKTVTLVYTPGFGCPDVTEFEAVVVGRLGYDPFIEGSPDHVFVRLERRAGGMDGRIEWRDAAGKWIGEQIFPSVSTECSGLARAVGFALAVQIQFLATSNTGRVADGAASGELGPPPEVTGGRAVPTPSPAPPPATGREAARSEGERPEGERPLAPPVQESAARAEPLHDQSGPSGPTFAMGAGPSLGLGFSLRPVVLGRLFGALEWQHLSIEIAAFVSVPATIRRADGAGFEQQHLFGSAALCAAASRWNGCLVANAGQVRMAGQDIDRPTSANVALVQVGLRGGIIQPLGRRAFVDAHADGLINITRWTGSLDQVPVWTAPRFGAAIGVDAGVRFR